MIHVQLNIHTFRNKNTFILEKYYISFLNKPKIIGNIEHFLYRCNICQNVPIFRVI